MEFHRNNLVKFDMLAVYAQSNFNCRLACQRYQELYPQRRPPHFTYFGKLHRRIQTTGMLKRKYRREGQVDNDRNLDILLEVTNDPPTSLRQISSNLNVTYYWAQKTLKNHKYHPYRFNISQTLHEGDSERRLLFCRWLLRNVEQDEHFAQKILWTDESCFTNCGVFNRNNHHHWSTENPDLVRETRNQTRFRVNVWCGMINDILLGPYFFEGTLTAARYVEFLQNEFEEMLNGMPLIVRRNMIFQQDGAPAHNARIARENLKEKFMNKWIGTHGPVNWPARSPDLSPLDYFLWGMLKNKVYVKIPQSIEELQESVRVACSEISQLQLLHATSDTLRRSRLCVQQNGALFEQLL